MAEMPKAKFQFTITYFKSGGKFYTEEKYDYVCQYTARPGRFPTAENRTPYIQDVAAHIRGLRMEGSGSCELPGLTSCWEEGYVLISHPDAEPILLLPMR